MECKKAKDLILTDYLDGRMGGEAEKALEVHLAKCSRCREFADAARKTIAEPFNTAEKMSPPASVWHNIRETIEEEKSAMARSPVAELFDKLRSFRIYPKPVFATAAVVAVILIVVLIVRVPIQSKVALNEYLNEQVMFLGSLNTEANGTYEEVYVDLGTSIEEYLL